MSEQVTFGIIGYGTQGGAYGGFINAGRVPLLKLTAIADVDPAARARAQAEHPEAQIFESYVDLLNSGAAAAVVTTVPHYLHPEMAMAALERGVHVLAEKPAGVYSQQVLELNEFAAQRPETVFAIMFNQRANPLYLKVKELVSGGAIGDVLRSNWLITTWWRPQGYYDQSAWRATWGGEGGGVLVNQAPHQLDLFQWICGVPKSVFAKVSFGFRRDIAVEDEVTAMVDYGNGATGVFVTATHDLAGTDRFEIQGTRGKIVVHDSKTLTLTQLRDDERTISDEFTGEQVKQLFSGQLSLSELYTSETFEFESAWGAQHVDVLQNFAAHILDGTELIAPGADGILGVRLANAIHLSAWQGREVALEHPPQEYLAALNERIAAEGKYEQRS